MMRLVPNYFEFDRRVGTAGQPMPEQFENVALAGFHSVINLSTPDAGYAIPNEGSIVAGLGMNYFQIPVPFDDPELEHLRIFFGLMDAVGGEDVFVHCGANLRVSAFLFHYLQRVRGYSTDQATSPVLRAWLPRMEPAWRRFLEMDVSSLNIRR